MSPPVVPIARPDESNLVPGNQPRVFPRAEMHDAAGDSGTRRDDLSLGRRMRGMIARWFVCEEPPEVLSSAHMSEFRELTQTIKTNDDTIREEVSLALGLAQRIRTNRCNIDGAYERLRFIFSCLMTEPPQILLATDERLRLQIEAYRHGGLISRSLARVSSGSPAGLVLAAVVLSTILWGLFVFSVHYLANRNPLPESQVDTLLGEIFFMNGKALSVITTAAFVGGVISIATRLGEFTRKRDLDPFAVFWTAMLKPLIGVVLSLFILATLAGGIISFGFLGDDPFNLKDNVLKGPIAPKVRYTLWALGFLAGFSERFAWDFVDRTEGAANGGAGDKKPR